MIWSLVNQMMLVQSKLTSQQAKQKLCAGEAFELQCPVNGKKQLDTDLEP